MAFLVYLQEQAVNANAQSGIIVTGPGGVIMDNIRAMFVGQTVSVDTGANQENVVITALDPTIPAMYASFAKAPHIEPFPITTPVTGIVDQVTTDDAGDELTTTPVNGITGVPSYVLADQATGKLYEFLLCAGGMDFQLYPTTGSSIPSVP